MNNGRITKHKKSNIDVIFVMTVFVLFVCCLLTAILAFAVVYRAIGDNIETRFDKATAVSFVMQKLRSFDSAGRISVSTVDGQDVLVLHETFRGDNYVTYIYSNGKELCELFVEEGYEFHASDGSGILSADTFKAELIDDILMFKVGCGDMTAEATYTLRSGKAAAL